MIVFQRCYKTHIFFFSCALYNNLHSPIFSVFRPQKKNTCCYSEHSFFSLYVCCYSQHSYFGVIVIHSTSSLASFYCRCKIYIVLPRIFILFVCLFLFFPIVVNHSIFDRNVVVILCTFCFFFLCYLASFYGCNLGKACCYSQHSRIFFSVVIYSTITFSVRLSLFSGVVMYCTITFSAPLLYSTHLSLFFCF